MISETLHFQQKWKYVDINYSKKKSFRTQNAKKNYIW